VHTFLAGVPLHDVWAVDLPRSRTGLTLADFLRATNGRLFAPSPPVVHALVSLRFFLGRRFHWDDTPEPARRPQTFADRLSPADRATSLAPAGARDGVFRVVYRFENEQLIELVNRTAHAAAASALVETPSAYRFYFAVYVRSIGKLTPLYMALIDPFRKLFVYPSLLRGVRATWMRTLANAQRDDPM
jgi:hypothetical protein